MKKLFLIDAYAIIYRSYYAFIKNPRYNSKGLNTSAIYGFVNTLEDILRREKPTHMAVAFDPAGKTFRHEAYEQYKAQREATPEDIRKAVPVIKKLIDAYNIAMVEVPGFEADDVVGTLAKMAEKEDFEVFMLTPDKDYGQLVSTHIFMYRPKHTGGFEVMGPSEVKDKYGLNDHKQVIDLLGLMGDSSDNIPGCPGVGEKTAVKLLQQFGSIDNLLKNTSELKGALKTKIEENEQKIIFSRFLATIKTDVPVLFDEETLKIKPRNDVELKHLFDELEFRTHSARIGNTFTSLPPDQPANSVEFARTKIPNVQMSLFEQPEPESSKILKISETDNTTEVVPSAKQGLMSIQNTPHNYILVDTKVKRADLISKLFAQKSFCFDTETTGLELFTSELAGMSFCFREGEAYFIPLPADQQECRSVVYEFKPVFENSRIAKTGQNIKFDLLMLHQYGIELRGELFDTMIAHYLVHPDLRHGMDYLAEIYLKYRTIHFDDLFDTKSGLMKDIRSVDPIKLCDYAAEDADITFRLRAKLESELKAVGVEKLFYEIEMPLMRVLAVMERNGVRIDTHALRQSSVVLTEGMNRVEKEIYEMAGYQFNVSSPTQVGEVLFDRLKLDEKAKKTKTGQYSTSEDVLEKLRSKHPVVSKILDYRGLKKLLSTYIDSLPQLINSVSGRIHTSYNQTVAVTGRLSSTNPNLQNIPIRDAQGKEIRKAFIPDDGQTFVSADYSQIELRIMAHLSNDENMVEAFKSGHDIHAATASRIYKVPISEVTQDMRRKAKTANFGIIYGISVFGLSDRLGIPRAEAKELIDGYFETYPQVKKYMDESILRARETGYVETLFGRKRFLPDINSQNSVVRGFAERNAINAPIQGTAADIIKIAMINIQHRLETEKSGAKMTMQVHDELNFTVPDSEVDRVKRWIIEEMQLAIKLSVPLIVDCGTGKNWLEAH